MNNAMYEHHIFKHYSLPFFFASAEYHSPRHDLPNWHDSIEVIYCISGKGTCLCDDTQIPLSPGDLCVVNPYCLHLVRGNPQINFCYLHIQPSFLQENGFDIDKLHFQEHITDPELVQIYWESIRIFIADHSDDIWHIAQVRHAFLGFLISLCQKYAQIQHKPTRRPRSFAYVMDTILFIKQNIANSFSIDDISKHVGISASHLSRIFHKITGISIMEYTNHYRCKLARNQILQGKSVSEAALSVGFNNLSYFTRTYKKYIGDIPSNIHTDSSL